MANSTFSFFSSIFGFVVAAISLFAFIVKICRSRLPSNRIKILESLLDETESFFKIAVEDGLLTDPDFIHQTERHLTILKTRTHVLRCSAYNATTLRGDFVELFNGTSSAIGRTCDSLRTLRAQVITNCSPHPQISPPSGSPSSTLLAAIPHHEEHNTNWGAEDLHMLSTIIADQPPEPAQPSTEVVAAPNNDGLYRCKWLDCQEPCEDPTELMHHLRDAHDVQGAGERRLTCYWQKEDGTCGQECRRANLRRHMAACHLSLRAQCPECHKNYSRVESLRAHMKRAHSGL